MNSPVINVVTRKVCKGKEAEFEEVLSDFIKKSLSFPGLQSVNVIRPSGNSQEYGILRQFNSPSSREQFYQSEIFIGWEKMVRQYCEGIPKPHVVTGLEAWFTLPGQKVIKPPPRWKMALLTLLAVYPLAIVVPGALRPFTTGQSGYLVNFVVSFSLVVLLTWVVMPNLTKLFNGWLYK